MAPPFWLLKLVTLTKRRWTSLFGPTFAKHGETFLRLLASTLKWCNWLSDSFQLLANEKDIATEMTKQRWWKRWGPGEEKLGTYRRSWCGCGRWRTAACWVTMRCPAGYGWRWRWCGDWPVSSEGASQPSSAVTLMKTAMIFCPFNEWKGGNNDSGFFSFFIGLDGWLYPVYTHVLLCLLFCILLSFFV